jgi:hypothetical protein
MRVNDAPPAHYTAAMIAIPDTRQLLHAYGLAIDTPLHLAALTSENSVARSAALYHLQSAIVHQGTPWPATGPIAQYLAALVAEGLLLNPDVQSVVLDVLHQIQDAALTALQSSDRSTLERLAQPPGIDVDKEIARHAESDELDALYEDPVLAEVIMARTFLGCLDALPAIKQCGLAQSLNR